MRRCYKGQCATGSASTCTVDCAAASIANRKQSIRCSHTTGIILHYIFLIIHDICLLLWSKPCFLKTTVKLIVQIFNEVQQGRICTLVFVLLSCTSIFKRSHMRGMWICLPKPVKGPCDRDTHVRRGGPGGCRHMCRGVQGNAGRGPDPTGSHGSMWEGLRAAGSALTAAGLALAISLSPFVEPPPGLAITNEQLLFLEVSILCFERMPHPQWKIIID